MIINGTEYIVTETDEYHQAESIGKTKNGNRVIITFSKNKEENQRAIEAVKKFFID
jgi:hypothetical protein